MPSLQVWHDAHHVGTLIWTAPIWRFEYDSGWVEGAHAFPLSPHFSLRQHQFEGDTVKWFFQNLLPEGNLLHAIAAREGVRPDNAFALLAQLGKECAGALSLIPEGEPAPAAAGDYREIAPLELTERVRNMERVPLLVAAPGARMSLAGAQDKLPIRYREGRILVPVDHSPTTHILKPDNVNRDRYPHTVLNEFFCMRLAEMAGLPVPRCERLQLAGMPFYLVDRFDRRVAPGGRVQRIHQNDLCQVLDKWPDYKYEEMGGATLPEYFTAIHRYVATPAPARLALLRWVAFNFLVGNSDAHAKNVSFLMPGRRLELAPFYDLLCVKVYGDMRLAASIGDHNQYGWVLRSDWHKFADSAALDVRLVDRTLTDLSTRLPHLACNLLAALPATQSEQAFLSRIVEIIDEHCRFALER